MNDQPQLTQEFAQWAYMYFEKENRFNRFLVLSEVYEDFKENTHYQFWGYSWFIEVLNLWCEKYGYDLNPLESLDKYGDCKDPLRKCSVNCIVVKSEAVGYPSSVEIKMQENRALIGDGFLSWADKYFIENDRLNKLVPKLEAQNSFEQETGLKNWTSQRFKKCLTAWAEYKEFDYNPPKYTNQQGRCIVSQDGRTVEMIYIG